MGKITDRIRKLIGTARWQCPKCREPEMKVVEQRINEMDVPKWVCESCGNEETIEPNNRVK